MLGIASNPPNPAVGASVSFTVAVQQPRHHRGRRHHVTRLVGRQHHAQRQHRLDRGRRDRHRGRQRHAGPPPAAAPPSPPPPTRRTSSPRPTRPTTPSRQSIVVGRGAAVPYVEYEAEAGTLPGHAAGDRRAAHLRAHQLRHRVLGPQVGTAQLHRPVRASSPPTNPTNSIVVRNSIPDARRRRRHRRDHQPLRQRRLRPEAHPVVEAQLALRQHRRPGGADEHPAGRRPPAVRRVQRAAGAVLPGRHHVQAAARRGRHRVVLRHRPDRPGAGGAGRRAKPAECTSITAYGAVPNDGIDDTAAIQRGGDRRPERRHQLRLDPGRASGGRRRRSSPTTR